MTSEQDDLSGKITIQDIEADRRLQPREYTMGDVGFVNINNSWTRIPYTRQGFRILALNWKVSSRTDSFAPNNVCISDELAYELPHLSIGHQISLALRDIYSPIGVTLKRTFPKPKEPYKHPELQPNTKYVRSKDDFLYGLIIIHLEDHLRKLAMEDSRDPIPWGESFEKLVGQLADERNAEELLHRTSIVESRF